MHASVIGPRPVHQNPWFGVTRERRAEAGGVSDWYRVTSPDSAMVVPVTSSGTIVMLRGLRDTTGPVPFLELPCGGLDNGEQAAEAATRELREETGYSCGELRLLGEFFASPGISAAKTMVYLATELKEGPPELGLGEDWRSEEVGPCEINALIKQGAIRDAGTLAGLAYWRAL
jgi:ADP-ribose pyrophosphatase